MKIFSFYISNAFFFFNGTEVNDLVIKDNEIQT